MAREIEIKLRIDDVAVLRHALKGLGARTGPIAAGRVHEWNELFDTARQKLKCGGQLLRIRTETDARAGSRNRGNESRTTLTFKSPVRGAAGKNGRSAHKVREEVEVQVADGRGLRRIFEQMGMRVWFRYEKYRTTFRLPRSMRWARGLLIEMDETPMGNFIELEGPASAIDRAAKELGYSRRDYIVANYFVLYRHECRRTGKRVGDMLFGRKPASRRNA